MDLFKNASAKEVIFVLPKTSSAFKNEEHFIILENEAGKSGKKISLLCSNPDTNKLAKKYQFDVLLAKSEDKEVAEPEDIAPEEATLEHSERSSRRMTAIEEETKRQKSRTGRRVSSRNYLQNQ